MMELSAEKKGGREEECVPSAHVFFLNKTWIYCSLIFPLVKHICNISILNIWLRYLLCTSSHLMIRMIIICILFYLSCCAVTYLKD